MKTASSNMTIAPWKLLAAGSLVVLGFAAATAGFAAAHLGPFATAATAHPLARLVSATTSQQLRADDLFKSVAGTGDQVPADGLAGPELASGPAPADRGKPGPGPISTSAPESSPTEPLPTVTAKPGQDPEDGHPSPEPTDRPEPASSPEPTPSPETN